MLYTYNTSTSVHMYNGHLCKLDSMSPSIYTVHVLVIGSSLKSKIFIRRPPFYNGHCALSRECLLYISLYLYARVCVCVCVCVCVY